VIQNLQVPVEDIIQEVMLTVWQSEIFAYAVTAALNFRG
jgi:hypothetical protein